jgi:hypothetical protein
MLRFLFILLLTAGVPVKLKKVELTKQVSVRLPEDFHAMNDDELARKFYAYRKPQAAFSSPDQQADFSYNVGNTPWRQKDIALLRDFYRSSIPRLYTKVAFTQDQVQTIADRQFAVFEFVAEVGEDNENSLDYGRSTWVYSYIQYTVEKGKVQIFHFTCPARFRQNWQETAKEIMQTIRISR